MEQRPIEIPVKINAKELFSFMLRHNYTTFSGMAGLFVSIVSLLLLALGYARGDDFRTVVLLVLGLLFTVVNPVLLYMRAKNQALTNPVYKGEMSYTLDETGITLAAGDAAETVEWSKIRKWKKAWGVHILYTTQIHAILFPVSAMGSHKDAIEELLKGKLGGK